MFRNLFALFASLTVGVTTAAAAVQPPSDRSLDDRLADAQKKIQTIMTGREMAPPPAADQYDLAWGNIYLSAPWGNWSNWDKNWKKWHKWNNWSNDWSKWNNWSNWHNGGWGNY